MRQAIILEEVGAASQELPLPAEQSDSDGIREGRYEILTARVGSIL